MLKKILETYLNWLIDSGLNHSLAIFIKISTIILIIAILSLIADFVFKRIIVKIIEKIVNRSKNKWDDIILQKKVFDRLSHFAPALIVHYTIKYAFLNSDKVVEIIQTGTYIYMIIVSLMVINSFFKALNEIYMHSNISKNKPIQGYLQLINIFLIIVGIIFIYSLLSGNEVKGVLTGLGAMAAILLLVFKDTILGFVASVQLSSNDMVKLGDWISMPKHGADGEVLEITLNTVKIQNWDKTISTIPTYALISESFTNWKGMQNSGVRRIKRFINIDMTSVKICSKELLDKLKKVQYLSDYIYGKEKELKDYNLQNNVDESVRINGKRLTNLGTFRKYVEFYLQHNPKINKQMTFLVRQLQPTETGIPIEIYVFSSDNVWTNYEQIQSDIFDHLLAIIPEFELQVFQNPSGNDFRKFNTSLT